MLLVFVWFRLTRYLRERLLGRNLITVFSTVNTPAHFSSGSGVAARRPTHHRQRRLRTLRGMALRARRRMRVARKRGNQGTSCTTHVACACRAALRNMRATTSPTALARRSGGSKLFLRARPVSASHKPICARFAPPRTRTPPAIAAAAGFENGFRVVRGCRPSARSQGVRGRVSASAPTISDRLPRAVRRSRPVRAGRSTGPVR